MSIDRSLRAADALQRHRNVLTRAERVEALKELGRWADGDTVIGMRKVAHRKAAVGKKDKAEKKEGETAAEETPAEEKK